MGFYECIYDCGDKNYCVSIGSSLDNFKSTSWIYCEKHIKCDKYYDIFNFLRRYATNVKHHSTRIKVIDTKMNSKGIKLSKIELIDVTEIKFKEFNLDDRKKILFSEFNDEPSWNTVEDGKIIIIDNIDSYDCNIPVDSPICIDQNIIFNWHTNSVVTIDEYNEYNKN